MISAYNDAMEGKDLLLTAEAELRQEGLDASPDALAHAEQQAALARGKFHSARDFLDGDPLLRVLGRVPWMGPQISAARDLADIGYEGGGIGVEGIAALRTINAIKAEETGTLGQKANAYLEAIEPQVTAVEQGLATIREKRDGIDTRWLLPPLSNFVRQLDAPLLRVEKSMERYRNGRAVVNQALGFSGPRSYLVLGLDNTELLPGGGLIGMYGVVTFEEGSVVERSFDEVSRLTEAWQMRSDGEYVEPPAPLKRYLLRDWTWNFAVSDWSPDFPSSARQALFFYDRSGADPVDDVVAIDFAGLEGLLAVLGPTEVEGYGVTVTSENVTEEILAHIGKPLHPGDGDHAFAAAVAMEVVDGVLAVDQDKWPSLLRTLDRLAREKHLFLYASDQRLQRSVRELGWAGEVRHTPGDYLMAVNASVHSTKLNLVLQQRMEVNIRLHGDGRARNTVTLHYENPLGKWARSRSPELISQMLSGLYGGYMRLLAPSQSRLVDVQLDGRAVGAEEVTREAGRASFGRYLPLPRDSTASLSFIYDVPAAVSLGRRSQEYRLLIQKQAGARPTPLRLDVSLPDGANVTSVSLDGRELPGKPLEIETDLSMDRELVVRYAA